MTEKLGPCFLAFGRYVNAFSCSAMRSTGELFLNPRNELSKLWTDPSLDEVDHEVLLVERLGFGLPSSTRG